MEKLFATLKNSRFALIALVGATYLILSTILRLALLVISWSIGEMTFWGLCQIFFIGTLYDGVFGIYFSLFFSFLLLLLPDSIYRSKPYRYVTYSLVFLVICGTYFVTFAEWIFWNEFNTRFNFIAIDFL